MTKPAAAAVEALEGEAPETRIALPAGPGDPDPGPLEASAPARERA